MIWQPVNNTSNNILFLGLNNFNKQRFCDAWLRKIKISSKFKIQIARNIQTNSSTRSIFPSFMNKIVTGDESFNQLSEIPIKENLKFVRKKIR